MSNMKTINLTRTEVSALLHALSMAEFRHSKQIDLFQHQIVLNLNILPHSVIDLTLKHAKEQLSICESLREKLTNINQFTDVH